MKKNKLKTNKYFKGEHEVFECKTFESEYCPIEKHCYDDYEITLKDMNLLTNFFKVMSAFTHDTQNVIDYGCIKLFKNDSLTPAAISVGVPGFEFATKICEVLDLYDKGVISFESLPIDSKFVKSLDFGTKYTIVDHQFNNETKNYAEIKFKCSTKTLSKILNSIISTSGDSFTYYFHYEVELNESNNAVYVVGTNIKNNDVKTKIIEILEKTRDNE